jgi:ketosteroid isomerase-like protein
MKKSVSRVALLLFAFALTTVAQEQKISPALESLVAAERAFARLSVEKGAREAFITFFADDGMDFRPHPVKTKEWYSNHPAPPAPPPVTLNWAPITGSVSAAGDLGFSTGPFTLTDHSPQPKPTQHGMFFSIWKKQSDNTWKVVVDIGVSTPRPVAPLDATYVPAPHPAIRPSAGADPSALLRVERDFNSEILRDATSAYLHHASNDARLHRINVMPVTGKDAIRSFLSATPLALNCSAIRADIARSGDLGYVLGSYQLKSNAQSEKGYYVRLWRKDQKGQWRLIADLNNALPEEK